MSIVVPVSSVIARMTAPPLPMTSRIFSGSILIVMIVGAHSDIFARGCVEHLVHLAEDVQAAGLAPASSATFMISSRDAVDLDVHLQRGDAVARAGDLEVHVAEVILVAEDVGQHLEVVAFLDQAHRDAGDRRLDRHARVHQRTGSVPQTLAIELEPFDSSDLRHDADARTGTSSMSGITASTPRRARLPWPISRRFGEPIMPVSPTENGGKL